jgi:signal transduction histidine kinase
VSRGLRLPKSNFAILAVIGGVAILLSVVSYQFSTYSTSQIIDAATEDIQSNSQRQAHDLSRILINKVEAINNNLRVVASAPLLQDTSNLDTAKGALSGMQDTTSELTEFYIWFDADGQMVWLSDISPELYEEYEAVDLSSTPYFTEPRDTGQLYYSTAIISNDGIPRLYVSRPIVDAGGVFKGVIAGAIKLEVLGDYLQSQIPSDSQGTVGMMDRSGIILYSSDRSALGTNVFNDTFQQRLPEDLKPSFNDFLRKSLSGGSGVEELKYRGSSSTLAYETVTVESKDFAVLYVTASHTFAGNVLSMIDQQRAFSAILILTLGGLAVGMAIILLTWNSRLGLIIKSKTRALEEAVDSLQGANKRLEEHDKLQQEFVNIAAHELRTPVQPLLGVAETMQLTMKETGENHIVLSKEEVDMLARNSKRLERLTQNILDVTRIENNKLVLESQRFDLTPKIQNVISETLETDGKAILDDNRLMHLWHRKTSSMDVTVRLDAPKEPITVDADKTRVFEVVSNLLRNALKFTKQGAIDVTVTEIDGQAQLTVKDSGRGIDSEILPRLFEKFATKSESGTGLGLYLSKNVIEAHNGRMWAENNSDGPGASFHFTLPVAKEERAAMLTDSTRN